MALPLRPRSLRLDLRHGLSRSGADLGNLPPAPRRRPKWGAPWSTLVAASRRRGLPRPRRHLDQDRLPPRQVRLQRAPSLHVVAPHRSVRPSQEPPANAPGLLPPPLRLPRQDYPRDLHPPVPRLDALHRTQRIPKGPPRRRTKPLLAQLRNRLRLLPLPLPPRLPHHRRTQGRPHTHRSPPPLPAGRPPPRNRGRLLPPRLGLRSTLGWAAVGGGGSRFFLVPPFGGSRRRSFVVRKSALIYS
mmetsp:Transcript_29733/g.95896  ORF Transcript_29733/g.95896 Transcript_29733/m.95896 type:complete len:244 (-) Transcript_29733:23-754(-)